MSGKRCIFFDNKNIQTFEKASDKNSIFLTLPNLCERQYKGHINGFVVDFLSLIYCWDKYIFSCILVFLGIIILPRSRIKISCYVTVGIIFLLGAILRLNESAQYPLWFDELVLFFKAGGNYYDKYFGVLDDMGNPPLINILYKIFSRFSYDGEFFRTIFTIIGSLGIFSVYLLVKDRISKKVGLISALVTAVSIYAISFSQIYRSYNVAFVMAGWKDILSAQYIYFIYGFEIIFISIFVEMKYKFFS